MFVEHSLILLNPMVMHRQNSAKVNWS